MSIELKSTREIDSLRVAGRMAAETLMLVGEKIRAGMTTEDINTIVHEDTIRRGARPAPLNYNGFPKSVCTSVNHVVCHGIPGKEVLRDGDIVNVDVTTVAEGMHGDCSATFYIGTPSPEAVRVTECARHCLDLGVSVVKDGGRIGDIGAIIQDYAEAQGFSIVRDYCGHGTGRRFHEKPSVPHYRDPRSNQRIKAGMVFTVEPMVNVGDYPVELLSDKWTVVTRDRSLSAQFEHTLAVTRTGCEVLTQRPGILVNSEDRPWVKLGGR